jgi:IS30 family transposase
MLNILQVVGVCDNPISTVQTPQPRRTIPNSQPLESPTKTISEIARLLGRHRCTMSREVSRGPGKRG